MMTSFWTDGSTCINKAVEYDSPVCLDDYDFETQFEVQETAEWISSNNFEKICLQFPDELLHSSAKVYELLKQHTNTDFYILADTAYSNCCVDEVAAAHVSANALVHYGHACFSGSKIPVRYVLPKQILNIDEIFTVVRNTFNANTDICLFYSTCFHNHLDTFKKKWFDSFPNGHIAEISTSRSKQSILGRILINSDLKIVDIANLANAFCIYVGESGLTSFNCSISVKAKEWFCVNPRTHCMTKLNETQWFKRRRFLIEKCKDAQTVGILICKVSGNTINDIIKRIKDLCKVTEKKSYIISVGKPNVAKLANLPEIDIYVQVACPENDLYSSRDFFKPIVYPYEFELACNPNRDHELDVHITEYEDLLPGHQRYCDIAGELPQNDVSLISGKIRNSNLVSTEASTQLAIKSNMALEEIGQNLSERSWSGLEQKLGETEVKKAEVGRSGVAIGYNHEPQS